MAQRLKAPAAKPEDPSLNLKTCIIVKGENQHKRLPLGLVCTCIHTYAQ